MVQVLIHRDKGLICVDGVTHIIPYTDRQCSVGAAGLCQESLADHDRAMYIH